MNINYNDCQVFVNGSGIIATSISVNEVNELQNFHPIGNRRPSTQAPEGNPTTTIQLAYFSEPHNEQCYRIVSNLKTQTGNDYIPVQLIVGNLSGVGYLENFNLQVPTNDKVNCSVNFICFTPLSGDLASQPSQYKDYYNTKLNSGIGHYWTSYPITDTTTGSLLDFSYTFKVEFAPLYKIGQKTPYQVLYYGAEESMSMNHETRIQPTFTGTPLEQYLTNSNKLVIRPISAIWANPVDKLEFYLTSGKVINNKTSVTTDTNIICSTEVIKYY